MVKQDRLGLETLETGTLMARITLKPVPASPSRRPATEKLRRRVPQATQRFLDFEAAERCKVHGCDAYLLEHHVTEVGGNFAQMARIWACHTVDVPQPDVRAVEGGCPLDGEDRRIQI